MGLKNRKLMDLSLEVRGPDRREHGGKKMRQKHRDRKMGLGGGLGFFHRRKLRKQRVVGKTTQFSPCTLLRQPPSSKALRRSGKHRGGLAINGPGGVGFKVAELIMSNFQILK